MSESDPEGGEKRTGDLAGEFHELGKNLQGILRAAWESEERKKLQEELRLGLSDLGNMVNQAANEFQSSPTGQRIKEDMEDFQQRVRSGEVENKVREEILSALRMVNSELEKVSFRKRGEDERKKE